MMRTDIYDNSWRYSCLFCLRPAGKTIQLLPTPSIDDSGRKKSLDFHKGSSLCSASVESASLRSSASPRAAVGGRGLKSIRRRLCGINQCERAMRGGVRRGKKIRRRGEMGCPAAVLHLWCGHDGAGLTFIDQHQLIFGELLTETDWHSAFILIIHSEIPAKLFYSVILWSKAFHLYSGSEFTHFTNYFIKTPPSCSNSLQILCLFPSVRQFKESIFTQEKMMKWWKVKRLATDVWTWTGIF